MGSWPSYPLEERPLTFRPEDNATTEDTGDNSALAERLELVQRLWAEVAKPESNQGGSNYGSDSALEMYARQYPDWKFSDLQNLRCVTSDWPASLPRSLIKRIAGAETCTAVSTLTTMA